MFVSPIAPMIALKIHTIAIDFLYFNFLLDASSQNSAVAALIPIAVVKDANTRPMEKIAPPIVPNNSNATCV